MIYAADFETTVTTEDCRVWAWGCVDVNDFNSYHYGNTLQGFFEFVRQQEENPTLYFHNLKFDGEFIISWLFKNGYSHVTGNDKKESNEFSTLISDKGTFYSIDICFTNGKHSKGCKILNSLNLLPFSVARIAKSFGLPISKLSIDYKETRAEGHNLTDHEIEYLHNDCSIVAQALNTLFSQGMTKMTTGSNALANFKLIVGKKSFERMFPIPSYDEDVRRSYRGGWTYLKPESKGKDISEGIVLDVNSLYPSVMYYKAMPYGEGIAFIGEYEKDDLYNLYVQMFTCTFKIRKNHLPTVQLKNNSNFIGTEYITHSGVEPVTLCMTNVDLQLFKDHYNVYDIQYHSGWKFKSTTGMFKDYIEKWNSEKVRATKENNQGMRTLAKLMLNALYGKFALNPKVKSKIPYMKDGIVHYKLGKEEVREPIYIPVGTFITSYAREKTIRSAQKVFKRFVYADTDSLHLTGKDLPKDLEISPTELGAWKHESTFTRARFLRQKCYIEEIENELHITCAGMPDRCYDNVTWDNFHIGTSYKGKLRPTHANGGIVLVDCIHTLRE